MDFLTVILALTAIITAVYYYFKNTIRYFEDRNIPYLKGVPFLGSMWEALLRRKSMFDLVRDVYNINPDAKYVGFYDVMTPSIVIRDPELVKSIGVKNFDHFPDHRAFVDEDVDPLFGKNLFALRGDRWRDVRTLLTPAFTSKKMKGMFKLMSDCAQQYGDYLANLKPENTTVDMKDSFTRYTNDVIATCAFGISVDSIRDRKNQFYVYGREATVFGTIQGLKFFLLRSFPWFTRQFNVTIVKPLIANFFKNVVSSTIKARDEQNIYRPDMLQLMMETRGKLGPGKELTIEDMTAQAFVFFFGGFESTATVMCFAAHEIGVNPEVQEKLHEEIDQALADTKGQITYEAINEMKYLDAIVSETLRMYPVNVMSDRVCTKSLELPPALPGLKPLVIEKDFTIMFPITGFHYDPKYFEDPNKFNPDRFLKDAKKIANSGAYLPFGIGPRMCIGNRFALLETKVLLFHILARCDLKPSEKTTIPMRLSKKSLNMIADGGHWLKVEPRQNCPISMDTKQANGVCKS